MFLPDLGPSYLVHEIIAAPIRTVLVQLKTDSCDSLILKLSKCVMRLFQIIQTTHSEFSSSRWFPPFKVLKIYYVTPILKSQQWLKVKEGIVQKQVP